MPLPSAEEFLVGSNITFSVSRLEDEDGKLDRLADRVIADKLDS